MVPGDVTEYRRWRIFHAQRADNRQAWNLALRGSGTRKDKQDTLDLSQPSDQWSWELKPPPNYNMNVIASLASNQCNFPSTLGCVLFTHSSVPAVDNFGRAKQWWMVLDSALQCFSLWAIMQPRVASRPLLAHTNALHSFLALASNWCYVHIYIYVPPAQLLSFDRQVYRGLLPNQSLCWKHEWEKSLEIRRRIVWGKSDG